MLFTLKHNQIYSIEYKIYLKGNCKNNFFLCDILIKYYREIKIFSLNQDSK